MTVTEKTTVLTEDENAKSLYTIGWFSVSNDPVITSENAYNGKSQTKGTCVFVSSLSKGLRPLVGILPAALPQRGPLRLRQR